MNRKPSSGFDEEKVPYNFMEKHAEEIILWNIKEDMLMTRNRIVKGSQQILKIAMKIKRQEAP